MIPTLFSGPTSARVLIVAEFPSLEDVRRGTIMTGGAGWELDKLLAEAGTTRSECLITSVLGHYPLEGKIKNWIAFTKKAITTEHVFVRDRWVLPIVKEGLDRLHELINLVQPTIIITLGDLPLWALTGHNGVAKWRGSMLHAQGGQRLLPTYAPSDILKQWKLRPIAVLDFKRAIAHVNKEWPVRHNHFQIAPTFPQALDAIQYLYNLVQVGPTRIAYDIETLAGNISCLGLAWNKHQAICIPFMGMGFYQQEGYYSEAEEAEILYSLYLLMTHKNFLGITQNGLFDCQYIQRKWHFIPHHWHDTMLTQHTLFSGMQKSLDFICSFHNEHYVYWKDDLKEWRTTIVADETQYWNYNCEDSARTWEASESLLDTADSMGKREQVNFQQSLFHPVLKMMIRGVAVDREEQVRMAAAMRRHAKELLEWITYAVGYEINPKSPVQMASFFYEELKQPKQFKRTSLGPRVSCDSASLEKVATREPILRPLIKKIEEWRSTQVFLSNFLTDKRDIDGRMRCSYNIAGTITFRFSSSENAFGSGGNLQQVPQNSED